MQSSYELIVDQALDDYSNGIITDEQLDALIDTYCPPKRDYCPAEEKRKDMKRVRNKLAGNSNIAFSKNGIPYNADLYAETGEMDYKTSATGKRSDGWGYVGNSYRGWNGKFHYDKGAGRDLSRWQQRVMDEYYQELEDEKEK